MRTSLLSTLVVLLAALILAPAATAQPSPASQPASAPATAPATRAAARRIHVFISGKVQGVGFRAFTQEQAQRLKLTGFVRNLADGRVEVVAEGPAADIAALITQIKQGPPAARVDQFDSTDETPTGEFEKFQSK